MDRMVEDFTTSRREYYSLEETVDRLRSQVVRLIQQRDATAAEDQANRLRLYDLEHYVGDLEMYNIELHAEVHALHNQLHPHPDPIPVVEEDPAMGVVEDQEPAVENEEDDDEENEPIEFVHYEDDDEVIIIDDD